MLTFGLSTTPTSTGLTYPIRRFIASSPRREIFETRLAPRTSRRPTERERRQRGIILLKKSNRLLRPCAPWQVFRLRELLNDPFLEFLLSGFTRTDMGYAIVVSQDD